MDIEYYITPFENETIKEHLIKIAESTDLNIDIGEQFK
jgi:hypothetical protein